MFSLKEKKMLKKNIENYIWVYLGSASAFIYSLIFSKVLPVELYADFIITIAFSAFSQLLVNFGADKLLLKSLVKYKHNRVRLLQYDLLFRLVLFCIVLSVVYYFFKDVLILIFIWYTLNALFPKSLAEEQRKIVQQNKGFGLEKLLSLFLITFNYVFLEESKSESFAFFGVLIVLRIASIVYQYYFLCNQLFSLKLESKESLGILQFKEHFQQSSFVMFALFSNAILLYGSQIILKHHASPEIISVVGLGLQLCLVVQIFQSQFIRFFNKEIFSESSNYRHDVLFKIKKVLFPSLMLVCFMLLISFGLESFYLGDNFNNLFLFSFCLSPWLVVLGPATVLSQYFLSLFNTKYYLCISSLSGALSIFLSLKLIPSFLDFGYLIQLYLSHFLSIILQFILVWRRLRSV